VVQVEVGEGARRKKQTHHNPIFSQVIKSRMSKLDEIPYEGVNASPKEKWLEGTT